MSPVCEMLSRAFPWSGFLPMVRFFALCRCLACDPKQIRQLRSCPAVDPSRAVGAPACGERGAGPERHPPPQLPAVERPLASSPSPSVEFSTLGFSSPEPDAGARGLVFFLCGHEPPGAFPHVPSQAPWGWGRGRRFPTGSFPERLRGEAAGRPAPLAPAGNLALASAHERPHSRPRGQAVRSRHSLSRVLCVRILSFGKDKPSASVPVPALTCLRDA